MLKVELQKYETIDKALKRLKKKVDTTKLLKKYRARTFYEKPSVVNRKENMKKKLKQYYYNKENY